MSTFFPTPPETRFERRFLGNYTVSIARCRVAHFYYNGLTARALRTWHPAAVKAALRFKYMTWPRRLAHWVRKKDVLDVGCGMSLSGVGFVTAGVRSYTGCDPLLKPESDVVKNPAVPGERVPCGFSPKEIMRLYPQIEYFRGAFEEFEPDRLFEVAVLHNTTEHLMNIEEVFTGLTRRLRPRGRIIFNHHNYASWNGHHMEPKSLTRLRPSDPEQAKYADWEHLRHEPEGYPAERLNRIRLDDLKALTERYFDLEVWHERESNEPGVLERLTDEVIRATPGYDRREMSVQHVVCTGLLRGK